MTTEERALEILKEAGVLQTGHFLLTSGRHSGKYLQCARIFQNSKYSEELCRALAERFADDKIDVVIGPAIGAILISYEVSRQLGVPNLFAERDENGVMTLRRGFSVEPGQRVLVVEDVITTGRSVFEVLKALEGTGAVVAGVGSIINRSGGSIDFGVPLRSVLKVDAISYAPEDCPLCREGLPMTKPGSRKQTG